MFTAAFWSALWLSIVAYFVTNGLTILAKVGPFALFLLVFLVQWATGSVWVKSGLVLLACSAVFVYLELAGMVPAITIPATPAKPVTPAK